MPFIIFINYVLFQFELVEYAKDRFPRSSHNSTNKFNVVGFLHLNIYYYEANLIVGS